MQVPRLLRFFLLVEKLDLALPAIMWWLLWTICWLALGELMPDRPELAMCHYNRVLAGFG